jgi:hypothetical protein
MATLGILAGGGELPLAIAESVRDAGRDIFVLGMTGADARLSEFPREDVGIGELGRTIALLKQHGCEQITFAGKVSRPEWSAI